MVSTSPSRWLAHFFLGQNPPWPSTPGFLCSLLECAKPHRSQVLLVDALLARQRQLNLPGAVTDELAGRLRQEVALEMLRQEEVSRVVAALAGAGLCFLLFKGTPLAYTLYPEACLRDRCDTDLLFQSKAAAEEAWLVLQGLGYERMNTVQGELVSYQFPCTLRGAQVPEMLDVHWATSNTAQLRPLSFGELWAQCIAVPQLGPAARTPCHEHALVLACLHRLAHVTEGDENKLIWLYDIHLLLQSLDDTQWRRFMACAQDKGVGGACGDGVENAVACFGPGQRGARIEALRELAALPGQALELHASVLARDLAQLRDAPGLGRRLQLLREYLFPSVAYMRRKYQPRWAYLLPYYYVKRMVAGAGRRLRGHLVTGRSKGGTQ